MLIVMAGSSGFLGTAWRDHLAREGHEVVRLVRGEALSANESPLGPVRRRGGPGGHRVGGRGGQPGRARPWRTGRGPTSYKRTFTDSRVATTRTLAEAVAGSDRKPALVAQSGVAGLRRPGRRPWSPRRRPIDADTFMAGVTRAVGGGHRGGQRRRCPGDRCGPGSILDKHGGALKSLLLVFKAGLGGPVGPGTQYFPTISLPDWVAAATHLATHDGSHGAYNLSGPNPTTNAEFGRELGRMLHRPSKVPVPSFVLNTLDRHHLLRAVELDPRRAGPAERRGLHLRAGHAERAARGRVDLRPPRLQTVPGGEVRHRLRRATRQSRLRRATSVNRVGPR